MGCGSPKSTDSRHLTRKASVNGLLDSLTSRLPQAEQAGGASLALKGGLDEAFFRRRESAEAEYARRFCASIGCECVSLTEARCLGISLSLSMSLSILLSASLRLIVLSIFFFFFFFVGSTGYVTAR